MQSEKKNLIWRYQYFPLERCGILRAEVSTGIFSAMNCPIVKIIKQKRGHLDKNKIIL